MMNHQAAGVTLHDVSQAARSLAAHMPAVAWKAPKVPKLLGQFCSHIWTRSSSACVFLQTKLRLRYGSDAILQRLPHHTSHNSSRLWCETTVHDCSNEQQVSDLAAACFQADLASTAQRQAADHLPTRAPARSSVYTHKNPCNRLFVQCRCASCVGKPA